MDLPPAGEGEDEIAAASKRVRVSILFAREAYLVKLIFTNDATSEHRYSYMESS